MKEDVLNLTIYVNDNFEEERALVIKDTNTVLLIGDSYHDKIDEKIDGFLAGLAYAKIEYELGRSIPIDEEDEMFSIIGFQAE